MAIEFYKQFGELGYLANYSDYGFYKDGIFYKTVEHFYQSEKYDELDIKAKIIRAKTAKEAAAIGRDRNNTRIPNFKLIKKNVMLDGVLEKFRQNEEIQNKLIETRNEIIVEKTVDEYYWGVGKDYSGANNFGRILMRARSILKEEKLKKMILDARKGAYILGHNHPDLDSIVSSYILKNILSSFNIDAHFCILDKGYEYQEQDKKLIKEVLPEEPEIISEFGDKKIILVDHNTLDDLPKNNVVGAIDHHIISGQVENTLEMEYASTGLLLYDLFRHIYNFSEEEKFLIGLTVLTDTDYLRSSRFKEADKKIYESLNLDIDVEKFRKIFQTTTNLNESVEKIVENNSKKYYYNDKPLTRLLISSTKEEKEKYFDIYKEYLLLLDEDYLLIWNDYDENKTTAFYNNEVYEFDFFSTSTFEVLKEIEKKNINKEKTYKKI